MSNNSEIIATITGKLTEPPVTHANILNKFELIKLLNWYNLNTTLDLQKNYLLTYCKANSLTVDTTKINNYDPLLVMARLHILGWKLEDKLIIQLNNYIKKINKTSKKTTTTVKKVEINNLHLEDLELYIDDHLFEKATKVLNYEANQTKVKQCLEHVAHELNLIESDVKEKAMDRVTYTKYKKILLNIQDTYTKILNEVQVKKVVTRKINKGTMTKNVKYKINNLTNISKVYTPIDIVQKKKLYLYDTNKKILICYYSAIGFIFSGTTLKNFTDKSYYVKIKDSNELSNSLSELNKLMSESKIKKPMTSGRFNENLIIIAIS